MISNGFSLIELLVVVAVLGILAAIGIPYYNDFLRESRIEIADFNCHEVIDKTKQIWFAKNAGVPCYLINSWGNLDTKSDMCVHNSSVAITAEYFTHHFQSFKNPYRPSQRAVQTSCPLDHSMKPGCMELFGSDKDVGKVHSMPQITKNPGNIHNYDPYARKGEFIFQCYNLDSNGTLIKYRDHFQTGKK
jgi:prepilin-type N-terminal cleavage/methylation domain-containing protein